MRFVHSFYILLFILRINLILNELDYKIIYEINYYEDCLFSSEECGIYSRNKVDSLCVLLVSEHCLNTATPNLFTEISEINPKNVQV